MKKIHVIAGTKVKKETAVIKKRVAAYARVSRDTRELMHSLNAQQDYFRKLIASHDEWEYAGVYVDEGISGTSLKGRNGFSRMLQDAEAGEFELILVKSISRFARNTLDMLQTVKLLSSCGVEVYFEEQRLSSFSEDGAFMLTLLSGIAQEESRSISKNIHWSFEKRKLAGLPLSGSAPFGYRCRRGQFAINENEAPAVRFIYRMYGQGLRPNDICRVLNAAGYRTRRGKPFDHQAIWRIINNEKYIGKMLIQKTYKSGPFEKSRLNRGQVSQVLVENNHEPIISLEDWNSVHALISRRRSEASLRRTSSYVKAGRIDTLMEQLV